MLRRWPLAFVASLLLAGACPALAFDASRIADPAVRACLDRSLPTDAARQVQSLVRGGH